MTDMKTIDRLAASLAEARDTLARSVAAAEDEIAAVRRRHMPAIRSHARTAARAADALERAVLAGRDLFRRPKSLILHGIRVGWRKRKGSIRIENAASVIARIEKLFPERLDDLTRTERRLIRAALNRLPAADLRRLGVAIENSTDEPIVEPVDRDLDRLVDALISGALLEQDQ